MNLLIKLSALCAVFVINSCAPIQSRLQEVQAPRERIFQTGYSLVAPNEKGWFVGGRSSYQLALGKYGDSPDETFAIQGTLVKLTPFTTSDEFIRLVKDGQDKDWDPQRFKIVKHVVTAHPEKGVHCAISHSVAEDSKAVKRSNKTGHMILELQNLTCAHPKDKSIGMSVTYSQRYYPELGDPRFLEKASDLLKSVEFEDL